MRGPRRGRTFLKRFFFLIHRLLIRMGIAVYPVHYYSPAVDICGLSKSRSLWAKPSQLPGLRIDLDQQIERLEKACLPYQAEYAGNRTYVEAMRLNSGPGFGAIEAQALHATIRHVKPSRIIEVGGGVSTFCSQAALEKNAGEGRGKSPLICIEPHPSRRLRQLAETNGSVRLIEKPVQAVPAAMFQELSESDILFIDSSHVVKAGSDVNHLVLEVLPRLRKGVLVHFHDIDFPYDYPRDLLQTFLPNNETSLVRAFLCFNERFEILYCLSHLHYERPERLKKIFPEYRPQSDRDGLRDDRAGAARHFPSSLWIRAVA